MVVRGEEGDTVGGQGGRRVTLLVVVRGGG